MYKSRLITSRFKKGLKTFPCIAILGARQVGKSTFIRNVMSKADYVVFDPILDIENTRQYPDLFLNNHPTPLILDEIQYAPELVSSIKRKIDENRQPGTYILTGSQQWQVMANISESLAGRIGILELFGFSLAEYAGVDDDYTPWLERWLKNQEAFFTSTPPKRLPLKRSLYELLWAGLLPEATKIDLDTIPDFYRSYQSTCIERDIRHMAEIEEWTTFSRFVQLLGALSAQEINYSQLGREIGINPITAKKWASLLTATYQWFTIPAFSTNSIKRVSQKPKGYIMDTGLSCFSQRISTPEALGGHPLLGNLFETAVVSEIRKLAAIMPVAPQLYHWCSSGGGEVDILLEWNNRYYPIEIKLNPHPTKKDTRGITAFRNAYPHLKIEKGLVISPCASAYPLNELDYALPWDWG